ncbi:sporulation protein [Bacillus manliponensis]|uniref:Sporulation protein n=1 Tax=Bacillus manliponensis TaxID=574376 RepID=A0A073JUA3_9BACI|nr:GerMN domain-containing protein [Bacillus manliponensis]KEK17802.1 sporulation protein [Bacillus manliponensis]
MPKSTFKWLICAVLSTAVLTGCGFLNQEKETEQIDPPKKVTYTDEQAKENGKKEGEKKETAKKEKAEQTIGRELYLVDKNGYVVPQTVKLPVPKGNAVIQQSLEYLVKNGPVTELLPNGFRAVLPADTAMTVDVKKDGTAIVDFSKEFKNYSKADERKIVEAVTWTLTQFKEVKQVKFSMDGKNLVKMPVNGTPLGNGVSRENGINFDNEQVTDITNTKAVTLYFIAQEGKEKYYVPITRRVAEGSENEVVTIVNELLKGPSNQSSLAYDFDTEVKLLNKPQIEDGKVTLNFNENIYTSKKENKISDLALESLVLTLTEHEGIKNVALEVNGKANVVNEKGEKLVKPVNRPQNVNTGSF